MKLSLILVGKTSDKHIIALMNEYEARIRHYSGFDITILPELRNTKALSQQQQKTAEGNMILKQINPSDYVVLLDERGAEMRSVELANWIERKQQTVSHRLVFVIGGPYGFSDDVYARANDQLSLSRLTFSHQMVRLFFLEQIYRCFTIMRGEPYHHE